MLPREQLLLILYFIVVLSLLAGFVILFFITFQRRKNRILYEKFQAEKRFEQEIAQSRLEIQEQTLKNVGWELHDNIGQLLSVANMQLNLLAKKENGIKAASVKEVQEVVAESLQEVRSLSKSLNNEVVEHRGLQASVENEIIRFNRLNLLEASLSSEGEPFPIPQKDMIILFRIIQEFFSNTIKHARASKLDVFFNYRKDSLFIAAKDDGIGFNKDSTEKNSGTINMQSRAALIGAKFSLTSSEGSGTSLTLQYPVPIKQYNYE